MQVRGNIGEEVYLRAKIKEIHILSQDDIQYTLEIDKKYNVSVDETTHQLTTTDVLRNVPENRRQRYRTGTNSGRQRRHAHKFWS